MDPLNTFKDTEKGKHPPSACQIDIQDWTKNRGRGVLGRNKGFKWYLVSVPKVQALFTELKKACSSGEISPKYILRIFRFSIDDISRFLIFGPKSVSGPHICKVVAFFGFFKCLFRISKIFKFWAIFNPIKLQKLAEIAKLTILTFRAPKMAENFEISKIPKYRWKIHKILQLWGPD